MSRMLGKPRLTSARMGERQCQKGGSRAGTPGCCTLCISTTYVPSSSRLRVSEPDLQAQSVRAGRKKLFTTPPSTVRASNEAPALSARGMRGSNNGRQRLQGRQAATMEKRFARVALPTQTGAAVP